MSNSSDMKSIDSPLMTSSPSIICIKTDKTEVKVEPNHEGQPDTNAIPTNELNLSGDKKSKRPRFTISEDSGRISR